MHRTACSQQQPPWQIPVFLGWHWLKTSPCCQVTKPVSFKSILRAGKPIAQILGEILKNVVDNLTLSCVKAKLDSRILHSLKPKTHMFGFLSVPLVPRQIVGPSHPSGSAPQHQSWSEPVLQLPGSAFPDPATLLSSLKPTLTLQPFPIAWHSALALSHVLKEKKF